ncbi:TonB-dependent receptor plug domain-containing protein [Ramlibacter algicola]|uniref:TonB-dependent receptor n=1 Tax=Ramlibacter algicola TaxID=2795217 RepID=A0A934Q126_9BURK|nr:TonB-dependent receptor [Ramlibacter algicola]MBK0392307.1 TonB-dependent receptor [Ramlibacter algicola]
MKSGTTVFQRTQVARAVITALCGTASLFIAQETLAQQSLQRVEVTGSNIKRTDTETASPVQVLTREDIEKTGRQSIQEVLRGITADGLGSIPTSFSNGFASGSAAVSLRGLGVNSTLVLVNGRRMTTYGLADDGQRNFVDLNSLPLEAVDRIEVLKDGASAIYGADAVGGVVNVILRKNYVGKAIGASYGQSSRGDGKTVRAFGSIGIGDLSKDRYNVFMSLEASKQQEIWSKDRGFIGESDLRSHNFWDTSNGASRGYLGVTSATANSPYGTAVVGGVRQNIINCSPVDPVTGRCHFNPLVYQQVQPQIDRLNFFTRGTLEISPAMTGYAELGIFNTTTKASGTAGSVGGGRVFSGNLFNPAFLQPNPTMPANHPDNRFGVPVAINYLFTDYNGRNIEAENTVSRFITGLQGSALGWDYDTAIGYIRSELQTTRTGFPTVNGIQAGLNNGTFRILGPGGRNTDAVLNAVAPAVGIKPTSSVALIDFKATRELANLAGGPLAVAVGAEARRENSNTPDYPGTNNGQLIGLGFSSFKAGRTVSAMFAEVNAPVSKMVELNGAVRGDHYSDFGNAFTPKVGFKIKPIDSVAFRGTYAEAFRAPGPAETGGSSFGFTNIAILSAGNPAIKPEKAKSYTMGFVLEPFAGFSSTIDYWRVERKDEILQADPALIGGANTGTPNSQVAGNLPGSLVIYDALGQKVAVAAPFTNASRTMTDGVDLDVKYRMNLGSYGKLTTGLSWTHVNHYRRTSDGVTVEYAGTHGPIVQSSGSGTPRDRISLTASLDQGPFSGTVAVNYVGKIKLVDHRGEEAEDEGDGTVVDAGNGLVWNWDGVSSRQCGAFNLTGQPYNNCKLPSFTTVDIFGKWTVMKGLDLNFGVQNLFDRKAPFDAYLPLSYGVNWNQGYHQAGAVGRYFTLGARYSF